MFKDSWSFKPCWRCSASLRKHKSKQNSPWLPRRCRYRKIISTSTGTDLQRLQVSLLRVTEQRGDTMAVPHTVHTAVSPQRKNLPDHRHPSQSAVGQFHDFTVADLLLKKKKWFRCCLFYHHIFTIKRCLLINGERKILTRMWTSVMLTEDDMATGGLSRCCD